MNFVAKRHKALKTDVGNVFLSMAIIQESVGPYSLHNSYLKNCIFLWEERESG